MTLGNPQSLAANAVQLQRLRSWVVFAALTALSLTAFIERLTLSVAAERMMPDLGLTQIQIGWY